MKYDVLYNFISPITGRILCDTDYVLVGDKRGVAMPSPILIDMQLDIIDLRTNYNILANASFILGFPNTEAPEAQILSGMENGFIYNTAGIVSTKAMIPIEALPNLPNGDIWIGDANDRPVASPTIQLSNLPNLTHLKLWSGDVNNRPQEITQIDLTNLSPLGLSSNPLMLFKGQIWRGTFSDQAEASDDLSALENTVGGLSTAISGLQLEIGGVQFEVTTIGGSLAGTIITVTALGVVVAGHTTALIVLQGEIDRVNSRIDNLRLNNISADGNVSFYNYRLIKLANPVDLTDGVNLQTMQIAIDNIPKNIELTGDVTGIGQVGTPFPTILQLTLDKIKIAQDTVNLNNQRIKNLAQSPVENLDAISAQFLWDLMHDEVGVLWQ